MNKMLYPKLALQNIGKNKHSFLPFSLVSAFMTAMFYMLHSISEQANDRVFKGASSMRIILGLGIYVVGALALVVLFYTARFLMKQRTREFGLYSLLGMEKKHIATVVLWETVYVGAASITAGILAGMLFSKLMFMVLLKLIGIKTDFSFHISGVSVGLSALVFTIFFLIVIAANAVRIFRLKPIDLLQSAREGEREPKAKRFLALLGFAALGVGYYLALTAKNPLQAWGRFFIAVICVMAGTYLLFLTGSIFVLKLLKNNKGVYYNKKRFITISGMMYRMKQNAVGLANICILCTAVLVVLSSTVSLYMGIDNVLEGEFPKDVDINFLYEKDTDEAEAPEEWMSSHHYDYDTVKEALIARADACGVKLLDMNGFMSFSDAGRVDGNVFSSAINYFGYTTKLFVLTADDYGSMTGTGIELPDGCALFSTDKKGYETPEIFTAYSIAYTVTDTFDYKRLGKEIAGKRNVVFLVVPSVDDLLAMRDARNAQTKNEGHMGVEYNITFNLKGNESAKNAFAENLRDYINDTGIAHLNSVDDITMVRPELFEIFGGIFFIGLFLGTLFLVITVMIIYYKQLSEGYEDRDRFIIMQKVGMSRAEVKRVIRSQVLQVFFLPIALALLHITFAFKIIKDCLSLLEFDNTPLFVGCTVGTAIVFSAAYYIVYMLTARTYYRITSFEYGK